MIYSDLPAGSTVFIDAGPFIHHFEPNAIFGPASTDMLERIENQEISAVTTTHILSEVAHRLMTLEAMQTFGWKSAGIALNGWLTAAGRSWKSTHGLCLRTYLPLRHPV